MNDHSGEEATELADQTTPNNLVSVAELRQGKQEDQKTIDDQENITIELLQLSNPAEYPLNEQ